MIFYDLGKDYKYKDVEHAKGTDWEGIICPVNKGHQRAGNRIGPLRINIKSKKLSDFLTTFLSDWIITDKVSEIFKSTGITGYELRSVIVCNMNLPFSLWELIVTGKGGDAHPDSGIYIKKYCEYCNFKRYSAYENGIIVDENNWDGKDILTVTGYPGHVLVTERVRNIIEENKLTGVLFTPSNELKWPEGVIKP